jgi:hypothetical protein
MGSESDRTFSARWCLWWPLRPRLASCSTSKYPEHHRVSWLRPCGLQPCQRPFLLPQAAGPMTKTLVAVRFASQSGQIR